MGALFVFSGWNVDMNLSTLHVEFIPIWVQLHGLPLDHMNLRIARRLGEIIGDVDQVDTENGRFPGNIRFL